MVRQETELLSAGEIRRALVRIGHEIAERNGGTEGLYLIGVRTLGRPLAQRLAGVLQSIEPRQVPVGTLDVRAHRDDVAQRGRPDHVDTHLPAPVDGAVVVLVDDVIYTGRTARAAMDALFEHGRPSLVRLAVLVDRGHREIPISPDFVGRNVPTSRRETIRVDLSEQGAEDRVVLVREGNHEPAGP